MWQEAPYGVVLSGYIFFRIVLPPATSVDPTPDPDPSLGFGATLTPQPEAGPTITLTGWQSAMTEQVPPTRTSPNQVLVVYCTEPLQSPLYTNGPWSVSAKIPAIGSGGRRVLQYGPTTFTVRNLGIQPASVSFPPPTRSIWLEPFLGVTGDGSLSMHFALDDGHELPGEAPASATVAAHPLGGGADTGAAWQLGPAEGQWTQPIGTVPAGAYWVDLHATDTNGYDQTQLVSTKYSVAGLAVTGLVPLVPSERTYDLHLSAAWRGPYSLDAPRTVESVRGVRSSPPGDFAAIPPAFIQGPAQTAWSPQSATILLEAYPFAGAYAYGLSYQVCPPWTTDVHDGRNQWATPGSTGFTVPPAMALLGASHGIPDEYWWDTGERCDFVWQELGEVRAGAGAPASFFSVREEVRHSPGVVSQATNAEFLDALTKDAVLYYGGHGNVGVLEVQGLPLLTSDQILAAVGPAEGPGGAIVPGKVVGKLVWISACHGWDNGGGAFTDSICGAIFASGADSVVGYLGDTHADWTRLLEFPVWELITKTQTPVSVAIDAVLDQLADEHTQAWLDMTEISSVRCEDSPSDGYVHIPPAF